jgi:hypothetical protein
MMALAFYLSGRRYSRDLLQAAALRYRTEEFFGRRNKLSVLLARDRMSATSGQPQLKAAGR